MVWLAIYPSYTAIVSILPGIVVVALIDRLLFPSFIVVVYSVICFNNKGQKIDIFF